MKELFELERALDRMEAQRDQIAEELRAAEAEVIEALRILGRPIPVEMQAN